MVHCSGMAKFEQAGPLFRMPTRETAAADPGCPERARVSARISLLSAPPLARPAAMRCDAMRCAAGQAAARPAAVRSSAPAPTTSSRLSPPLPASRPACLRRRAWGVDFRPGTQELVPALWLTGDGAPKQKSPSRTSAFRHQGSSRAAAGQQGMRRSFPRPRPVPFCCCMLVPAADDRSYFLPPNSPRPRKLSGPAK